MASSTSWSNTPRSSVAAPAGQHVQRNVVRSHAQEQLVHLRADGGRRQDALHRRVGEEVTVALQCEAEESGAVLLEAILRGLPGVAKSGEVEVKNDVAVAVRRRSPPDVGAGKQRLEPVGRATVVVALQQRHPARLPEPARAEEKDVTCTSSSSCRKRVLST